jgi:hypothetical protein
MSETVEFKLNSNQINESLQGGFERIDWNEGLKQNFGKVMKILDLQSTFLAKPPVEVRCRIRRNGM